LQRINKSKRNGSLKKNICRFEKNFRLTILLKGKMGKRKVPGDREKTGKKRKG